MQMQVLVLVYNKKYIVWVNKGKKEEFLTFNLKKDGSVQKEKQQRALMSSQKSLIFFLTKHCHT